MNSHKNTVEELKDKKKNASRTSGGNRLLKGDPLYGPAVTEKRKLEAERAKVAPNTRRRILP